MLYVLYFNYCNSYHCGIDVPDILAAGLRITSRMFPQQEPLESVSPAIPIIPNPNTHQIPMEEIDAEEPVNDAFEEYEVDEDDEDDADDADEVDDVDDEASVCILFNICYKNNIMNKLY